MLRKRSIQYKGGRQICGCQRLLNRTNCLGLSRFCSSLCLEKELIVFLTEKKHCYCLLGNKSHSYSGRLFHLLFSIRKDKSAIWKRSRIHYITSSSASAYGTIGSYLDKNLTRALVQHQKVTDVTYIAWLKELKRAKHFRYLCFQNPPVLWEKNLSRNKFPSLAIMPSKA